MKNGIKVLRQKKGQRDNIKSAVAAKRFLFDDIKKNRPIFRMSSYVMGFVCIYIKLYM